MYPVNPLSDNWLIMKIANEAFQSEAANFTGTIFDLGCGTRPFESEILKVASKYVGVDWSNSFHGMHADISADLNKRLPIEDNIADAVVSFSVLEHLCEPQSMLNEAYRILKPGGRIFLAVPFQWWVHEAPYDYFRFTRYGLEYMFEKAGFQKIAIHELSGFWTTWFVKLNYQTVRLIRGPKLLRLLIRMMLVPVWFLDQCAARLFDRYWPCPQETQAYSVTATKQ